MFIYDARYEVNKGILKGIEVRTRTEFKLRYGNSYVSVAAPYDVMSLMGERIEYDSEVQRYKLYVSRFKDMGLIGFIQNYRFKFSALNGFDKCGSDFPLVKGMFELKFFEKLDYVGDNAIYTLCPVATDLFNVLKTYAVANGL